MARRQNVVGESDPGGVLLLVEIIAAMTATLFDVAPWSTAIIYGSTVRESGLVLLLFFWVTFGSHDVKRNITTRRKSLINFHKTSVYGTF